MLTSKAEVERQLSQLARGVGQLRAVNQAVREAEAMPEPMHERPVVSVVSRLPAPLVQPKR